MALTSMKKPGRGWAGLLAGSPRTQERVLRVVRELASDPPGSGAHMLLAGADQAIAATAALRGAAACREFFTSIEPLVARVGRKLEMFPDSIDNLSFLTILSLVAVAESVGASLPVPDLDLGARFKELMLDRTLSRVDRVTVALLALDRGRPDDVRTIFGKGAAPKPAAVGTDPVALVRILDAAMKARPGSKDVAPGWDVFLRGFPAALAAEEAEWRQLLLAARVASGRLGETSMDRVADVLHRRVLELAAEEAA